MPLPEIIAAVELQPGEDLRPVDVAGGDGMPDVDPMDAADAVLGLEVVDQAPEIEVLDDYFDDSGGVVQEYGAQVFGADRLAGLGEGIGADGQGRLGGVEEDSSAASSQGVVQVGTELGWEA